MIPGQRPEKKIDLATEIRWACTELREAHYRGDLNEEFFEHKLADCRCVACRVRHRLETAITEKTSTQIQGLDG